MVGHPEIQRSCPRVIGCTAEHRADLYAGTHMFPGCRVERLVVVFESGPRNGRVEASCESILAARSTTYKRPLFPAIARKSLPADERYKVGAGERSQSCSSRGTA